MGLRLTALNLWLRFTVKRKLARMKSPDEMRTRMERDAQRYFTIPADSNFLADVIRRDLSASDAGMIDAIWASRGRPDRRKVILYFHGGAYIAGSPRTHKHLGAALAGSAGVRAVLPDYGLAPEQPFPAAIDDAVAAYRHLLDAGYAAQEVAFAGDSAGGGLCFAASLALQDHGLPQPACIVAFSPWVDLTGTASSHRRNASRDPMLPGRRLDEVVRYYLGEADRTQPLASPLFGQWDQPPPSLIMASRSEILADDATRLAERLRSFGGDVQLDLWRNLPHAWPIFTGRLAEADQAVSTAGGFIARHLASDPDGFWDASA